MSKKQTIYKRVAVGATAIAAVGGGIHGCNMPLHPAEPGSDADGGQTTQIVEKSTQESHPVADAVARGERIVVYSALWAGKAASYSLAGAMGPIGNDPLKEGSFVARRRKEEEEQERDDAHGASF